MKVPKLGSTKNMLWLKLRKPLTNQLQLHCSLSSSSKI
uniref:Uncharacterized protein n=1 Tax=Rhizophora mucronata TaxID=61149 RepID=A0A2P2PFY9_RHIMU